MIARLARSAVIVALVLPSVVAMAQPAPTDAQQRLACFSDAFRLCASSIPDRMQIRACLGRRHAELSAGCRAVYDASVRAGQ